MTKPGFICCLWSVVVLAATADNAAAQSGPSPWRFGVAIGGGSPAGVVAEYWSGDFGVEARLGSVTIRRLSVRVSPKWRVGAWDGGEASWRVGVEWLPGRDRGVFGVIHGVELARVTDGGHVIGGSYNLPLLEVPDTPDEGPEDPEDPSFLAGVPHEAVGLVLTLIYGEFTYRYQPRSGG